jgi:hypothetical protein
MFEGKVAFGCVWIDEYGLKRIEWWFLCNEKRDKIITKDANRKFRHYLHFNSLVDGFNVIHLSSVYSEILFFISIILHYLKKQHCNA